MSAGHVRTKPIALSFVMCEHSSMTIREYRKRLGLSQEAFAAALGFTSKGFISQIEEANRCSAKVALVIEKHSGGLVDASTLNEDVNSARKAAA